MISFAHVEDRLLQLWIPGVDAFYRRMTPDPWTKCDDDLRDAIEAGDGQSVEHAIVSYEARKRRLLELYRQFREIQDVKPAARPDAMAFVQAAKNLLRAEVLCDGCQRGVTEVRSLRLFSECQASPLGDPERVIRSVCLSCERSVR